MKITEFSDGYVVLGDSTSVTVMTDLQRNVLGSDFKVSLVLTDPPYGNIVSDKWDKVGVSDHSFANWMVNWTHVWSHLLEDGGAFYVWGGIGRPGFRPFFRYLTMIEDSGHVPLKLANLITWSKKRGYGIQHNYLFTREELAYFIKGDDIKKPRCFNVPLLDEKRGYAGYNKKYPARSEYKRRTNVWTDITEVMRGKLHTAQKPERVMEIPIEVHTQHGEWVIDPFAGSGTTGIAARNLGRKFLLIENDEKAYNVIIDRLKEEI